MRWQQGAWLAIAMWLVVACGPAPPTLTATPPPAASEPLPLTIGWGVTPITASPAAVLWLAEDLGFYAAEGLKADLVLVAGAPNLVAGMRAGQIDVGALTAYESVLLTATKSLELRMIGGSGAAGQNNTFMVVARDSVGSLNDLRGKTFAIARLGSYDDTLARQFLRARHVEPDGVQFLALGEPNVRLQALIAGQVDATLTSISTWINVRQQPGLKILAPFDEVNMAVPSWPSGNVVTAQVLQTRPEALRRFVRAIIKTSRMLATNRQAWIDAMLKRRPDMTAADLGELWDLYPRGWAVNGGLNLTDYARGADLLYATSPDFAQVPRIAVTDWADTRFVDGALRDLGIDPSMDVSAR